MAGEREPPPLFDDEDPRKDEENDIFASAVQSPVSDEKAPPKDLNGITVHPLTEPSDDVPIVENPLQMEKPPEDLFKTCDDSIVDKLKIVSLDSDQLSSNTSNLQTVHMSNESILIVTDQDVDKTNITNKLDPSSHFLNDNDTTEILLDDASQEISLNDDEEIAPLSQNVQLSFDQVPTKSSIMPPVSTSTTQDNSPFSVPFGSPTLDTTPTSAAGTQSRQVISSEDRNGKLEDDSFLEITVSDPQKIGDGIGAYMAYKLTTKTNIKFFRKNHWSVTRRFSDFLGLHGKLVEKHLHSGIIIPPAPEKDALAATKIKLGSDRNSDSSSTEFLERRRAALERYMNRTASHPTLRTDPDFREFLELDAELPKATQTSAISSAGVMRLFNRVGETVNKMTFKMEESDQWYEEKTIQIENLDAQLRKLHGAMEMLVGYRRELAHSTVNFSKSAFVLSSVEEHSSLSRALHQIAQATESIHSIHYAQADADFFHLSETIKDYINLIGSVKEVFHERVKTYQTWQHSVAMLGKKRENKAKAELSGRIDKVEQANEEVKEWEIKVDRSQEEFERISKAIKTEMEHFDIVRVSDYKDMLIKYLEALVTSQQQIVKVWESFLPEAKAIS